ncbi:unnamed protein product [Trichobilharzia regenti]|nr:unnamed protein product [Trichobilharzia regenti]
MHNWLFICVPETPERPTILTVTTDNTDNQGVQEYAELFYTSIYFHSQLKCYYEKGKARLLSDNLSTIAILKDVLTREANKRKIQLTIQLGKLLCAAIFFSYHFCFLNFWIISTIGCVRW